MKPVHVEDILEWVYRQQAVDVVLSRNDNRDRNWLAGAGISSDGCAIVERQSILGTRIDGGGYALVDIHPDAESVHIQIGVMLRAGALSHTQVGLLLQCGKTGGVPDWGENEYPIAEAVPGSNGRPTVSGPKDNRYCPIKWEPSLSYLDDLRRIYSKWHMGLVKLSESFSLKSLKDYQVLPPAVHSSPWAV